MYKLIQKTISALILISLSVVVHADDIDIINKEIPIKSNILFVMDLSGSMNDDLNFNHPPTNGDPTRLDVLKGAFQDIIKDPVFKEINMGLTMFSGAGQSEKGIDRAHGISYPIAPVEGKTAQSILSSNLIFTHPGTLPNKSYMPVAGATNTREYLKLLSEDPDIWKAGGFTPIVDALYEAALYFRGDGVNWGAKVASDIRSAHPSTFTGDFKKVKITPACNASTVVSCTKGSSSPSCGVAPGACNSVWREHTRSDSTGGRNCTTNTNSRIRCGSGQTSCGLGTNCVEKPVSDGTKVCVGPASQCLVPPYTSCREDTRCNAWSTEGACIGHEVISICKKPRTRYFCDAAETYTCEFEEEQCTKCPDPYWSTKGSAKYTTPITEKCPANGIVLLSDGEPTINESASDVASLIGSTYANNCDTSSSEHGRCGPELAAFLSNEDQNLKIKDAQNVTTFTVGLALKTGSAGASYLRSVAKAGGGGFVTANNRADLAKAFKQAILAIGKKARSFSAPTYTVNPATQLTHGEYVYVPVFDQGVSVAWPGNLKKYKQEDGKLYGLRKGVLTPATDKFGKLNGDVQDLWSKSKGGDIIVSGGAANLLDPAKRKLLTNSGLGIVDLSTVSDADLGAADTTERTKLLSYIRGYDDKGNPRHHMGDIIHSKPVQLAYSATESLIFVGTNEGYLHAIRATDDPLTDGTEAFAFMPSTLLKNIKLQYDAKTLPHHVYGVDGPLKLWIDDKNNNGFKDATEDAYLYFGLRRGGSAYYALKMGNDIDSQPAKLAWKIDKNTSSFSDIGLTWSEPVFAKLRHKGSTSNVPDPVLVFGGGYVDDHGDLTATPSKPAQSAKNVKGSDVYIVDAKKGTKIWKTKQSDIAFAVPAKIRTLDTDRNGSIDRLYFGDTGGNLWRVDLGSSLKPYDLTQSKVTHIAQLGDGSGKGANDRQFFNEPDVALIKHNGRYAVTISIGSGSRPDPLNIKVENKFFMVLDKNVFKRITTAPTLITLKDLLKAPVPTTTNLVSDLNKPSSSKGWYAELDEATTGLKGEKVLASALTFQNKVLFTTFGIREVTAVTYNKKQCGLNNRNEGRLYALDLLTGGAVLDLSGDKSVTDPKDRSVAVAGGEILETPQIIYGEFAAKKGGKCTADDCERPVKIHAGKGITDIGSETKTNKPIPASKKLPRWYWLDNER